MSNIIRINRSDNVGLSRKDINDNFDFFKKYADRQYIIINQPPQNQNSDGNFGEISLHQNYLYMRGENWIRKAVETKFSNEIIDDITLNLHSLDVIIGAVQSPDGPRQIGYYEEIENVPYPHIVGTKGGAPYRFSTVSILCFKLPQLPIGKNIDSLTLRFQITGYRAHNGQDFDSHVYYIDNDEPQITEDYYYYHGPNDERSDVIFIDSQHIDIDTSNTQHTQLDPPIDAEIQIEGETLTKIKELYNGQNPSCDKIFFRLNRSTEDINQDLSGESLNRYNINIEHENITLYMDLSNSI